MELIPIIENSLLIFIGILLIVVLFSYISYKFGDAGKFQKQHAYSHQVSERSSVRKVKHFNNEPTIHINEIYPDKYYTPVPHSYESINPPSVRIPNRIISDRFIVVNDLKSEVVSNSIRKTVRETNYKFII